MGPQHPSTHGVLRIILQMAGERILNAECIVGYLHRGVEKIAESRSYHNFIPYTDRLDYMAGMSNNLSYVMAVEKLLEIEAPERAQYLRVICAELSRISGHIVAVGAAALDIGAMTVLLYGFRDREMILDLFEMLCGSRMTVNYMRVGGVSADATDMFLTKCRDFVDYFPKALNEYEQLLTNNRIWLKRTKDVGIISAEDAVDLGLGGPNLRASGVNRDLRRDEPYLVYDRMDFRVPLRENGDVFDRYIIRIWEMRASLNIIRQCLDQISPGPVVAQDTKYCFPERDKVKTDMESMIQHFKLVMHGINPPEGEVYFGLESPKGELGFYIVSDGSENPYRLKIRSPSFVNLESLNTMCTGGYVADVIAVIGSLDPVMGETDK
jgi:NADH-quinone oxidoreductase subunit D